MYKAMSYRSFEPLPGCGGLRRPSGIALIRLSNRSSMVPSRIKAELQDSMGRSRLLRLCRLLMRPRIDMAVKGRRLAARCGHGLLERIEVDFKLLLRLKDKVSHRVLVAVHASAVVLADAAIRPGVFISPMPTWRRRGQGRVQDGTGLTRCCGCRAARSARDQAAPCRACLRPSLRRRRWLRRCLCSWRLPSCRSTTSSSCAPSGNDTEGSCLFPSDATGSATSGYCGGRQRCTKRSSCVLPLDGLSERRDGLDGRDMYVSSEKHDDPSKKCAYTSACDSSMHTYKAMPPSWIDPSNHAVAMCPCRPTIRASARTPTS